MATNQSIAAQVSAPTPLSGQKNRSSNNFQFLEVPSSGNVTVSMLPGATCSIMQDVSGTDPVITTIQNGSAFAASKVKTGNNYYFASPGGTSTNFAVTLSGDI